MNRRPKPPVYDRSRDGNVFAWIISAAETWRAEIQLRTPTRAALYAIPPNRVVIGGRQMPG